MAVNGLNYTSGNKLFFTTSGSTRGVVDNEGRWGLGTLSPTNIVHISGATDPLTIAGLQSGTTDGSILSIDTNGVVGTRNDILAGGSISSNVITLTDSKGATTDLTVDAITSLGYNGSWGVSGDTTGTATASVALPFITAGSYDANTGTITLDVNDASGVSDITITGLDGSDTFVTSGSINSPVDGTLRLTRNDAVDIDITGFTISIAGDDDSSALYMGDTFTISGGTGIVTAQNAGVVTVTLDDIAGVSGDYGSASQTLEVSVNGQGQITSISAGTINITSSQVSDFDSSVLSSVFESTNFVDSTEIDFTVTDGVSVTAGIKSSSVTNDMLAGSIANDKLVNDSVTLGSTEVVLGAAATTSINGMVGITATTFTGALVGNAETASKWETARTLSLGTDLSGSVSIDGSGDVTLNADIVANAVGTTELADNAVTQAKMADDSVGTAEIIDANVTTAKLADNAVTQAKMADNSVGTAEIINGNVTNDKLANSGFNTSGTTGTGTLTLGGDLKLISSDSSVVINNSGNGVFDFSLTDGEDTFVTSGAYTASTGSLSLTRNDGAIINVSGTWDYFTSVSEADNQLTFTSNDNTDSSVTIKAMTGGTFDLASGVITAEGSDTPSNISLGTDFVTGVTEANNVISVVKNGGSASSLEIQAVTGLTIADNVIGYEGTGSLGAGVTVDAITSLGYNGSWGVSGETTGNATASVALPFITAGSYDANTGTITLDVNDASGVSDITITGLDGSDTFVTGGTINSPADGTLRLRLNDGTTNVDITGFTFGSGADSGSSTYYMGDSITINGLDGITTSDNGNGVISIDLDNTAVSIGSYGDAATVSTFTVDQQGRLTAAGEVSIEITASQVSDFSTSAETAIFQVENFVDSSNIEFSLTAGTAVSADLTDISGLSTGQFGDNNSVAQFTVDAKGRITQAANVDIDGSAILNNNAFTTISVPSGNNPEASAYNGTLSLISSDSSVSISGNSTTDTIDIKVNDAAVDTIYTADGQLTGVREVDQNTNSLSFINGDFSVDGDTLNVDYTGNSVGIGVAVPNSSAVLEVASTSKGFLFPRMTETQRLAISVSASERGLMVYQTDADEGIYIYKSFGWVQVI